jgi:hypothetical protein
MTCGYALTSRTPSIHSRTEVLDVSSRVSEPGRRSIVYCHTLDKIVNAQPDTDAETSTDNRIIAECDRKLSNYRATLDAGGDPEVVSEWIAQTQAEKSLAEARLRQRGTGTKRLTREQIRYIVTTLTDITQVIHDADPRDKTETYNQLGLRLTYHPGQAAVLVEARPAPVCVRSVSEGGLEPPRPFGH